jgi:tRNA(His) 5'-end guanylyltransferase
MLAMVDAMKGIVKQTQACLGYTQSDEITIIIPPKTQHWFNGKVSKINSVCASLATAYFNVSLVKNAPDEHSKSGMGIFDCRSFSVPTLDEAVNSVLWRVQDARRNSVSSLCRTVLSSKQMNGLNVKEMKQVMLENGVDWNALDTWKKYGTFARREAIENENGIPRSKITTSSDDVRLFIESRDHKRRAEICFRYMKELLDNTEVV